MWFIALAEPKQRHACPARMCNVNAVDGSVVLDVRLHRGFPENAVVSGGFDSQEVGVF